MYLGNTQTRTHTCMFFFSFFPSHVLFLCLPNKAVLLSCNNRFTGTSNTPRVKPLIISAKPHPCSLDQLPDCLSLAHLCLQLLPLKLPNSHPDVYSTGTSDSHLHITNCSENLPLGVTTPQLRFAFSSALCDRNNTILLKTSIIKVQNIFTVLHYLFLFQNCTENLNSHDNHDSHKHDSQPTGTDQVLMFFVNRCSQFTKCHGHHSVSRGNSLLNQGNKFALHLTRAAHYPLFLLILGKAKQCLHVISQWAGCWLWCL